jgi:CRISPR/Cas system-associated endoribonuclease Cas2
MKTLQHETFVNLYNKDNNIFNELFKDTNTLRKLSNQIIKISKRYKDLAYSEQDGADKVKGDLFEIFTECFFKVLPTSPSKGGGYGIYNYQPAPAVDDYGVDGFGVGMDEKPLTVQVKFRSDITTELTQDDIKQFPLQSLYNYGVDKETRTNMIVFTNSKGLHWVTESRVFDCRLRAMGYEEISGLIDNNSVFWKNLNDLIDETIKFKYKNNINE